MQFAKATKKKAKLRIALDGPAGSGKTYSSLLLAKHLGGRVALIDTEHGSASKYADRFDFDAVELDEFSLDTYLKAIDAARGYDVLVVDSLSHAWTGKGGALEEVDRAGGANKFTGWRNVTPKHNRLVDALLAFPGHVVCTMRTKMEYVLETDAKGKQVPRKVGMAPVQREGMEYEFDVVVDLTTDGNVTVSKTRCPDVAGSAGMLRHADVPALAEKLKSWVSDGVVAPVPPASPPAANSNAEPQWEATETAPLMGSQPTPLQQVETAIDSAATLEALDAVVPRINKLTATEKARVRARFTARRQALKLAKETPNASA